MGAKPRRQNDDDGHEHDPTEPAGGQGRQPEGSVRVRAAGRVHDVRQSRGGEPGQACVALQVKSIDTTRGL